MSVLADHVRSAGDAVALLRALVPEGDVEGMLVLGLDPEHRLCGVAVNPRHRALSFVKVWELEALREELDACSLVVAVFPTGDPRVPTTHECETFADLARRTHRAQVLLLDCIVLRGHQWWSLRALQGERRRG